MGDNGSLTDVFILLGLNGTENHRFLLFPLTLLCYLSILLVNATIIAAIALDKSLHQPMYILLCTFCLNGLYGTAGFYPKFLWDLLSARQVISYAGCLIQALVMYSFTCSDLTFLAVMAYDRYLAICRPLEYHAIMTRQRIISLVCFSWLSPLCIIGTNIIFTSRLKLCGQVISRLFCVNWMVVGLACYSSDTFIITIGANLTIAFYFGHGIFIMWSYACLLKTCAGSLEKRARFIQTCVPHLFSLLTFNAMVLFDLMILRLNLWVLPRDAHHFFSMEFLLIPPIMHPVIYGLMLTKIRRRVSGFMHFVCNCLCLETQDHMSLTFCWKSRKGS